MHITKTNVNAYTIRIEVKESSVELQKSRKHVLDEIRSEGKVSGFMKGSEIPEEAIVKQYGETFIMNKSLDHYLEKAYPKILRKAEVTPVAPGNITAVKGFEPLEFTLEVEILPAISLDEKAIKKIKVKKTAVTLEEKEVDDEVEAIKKRFTHYHSVWEHTHDGAEITNEWVENGDRVLINAQWYEGKWGTALPETKVPDYSLTIGSHTFIPGFEEELIGAKKGDEVGFDITFPADYHSEAFKNKTVYFSVKIEAVEKPHTPEFDEDFIEKLRGKRTDMAWLRDILRDEIKNRKTHEARRSDEEKLLKEFLAHTKYEFGPELIKREVTNIWNEQKWNMEQQWLTMEAYLGHVQMTEESYKNDIIKPEAEKRIASELILKKLHEILGIEADDAEVAREVESVIAQYSNPEVVSRLREKLIPWDTYFEDIKSRIAYRKVVDSFLEA